MLLVFLVSSTNLFADGHIKFMGVEIAGDYKSFKDSLESKGFIYTNSFETMHKFYGKFTNEIVQLEVLATPRTNKVCKVIAYFPEKDTWSDLKKDYFAKKKLYSEKYPIDRDFEFFMSPYDDGDGYEMRAVSLEKCRFISFFLAIGGHIIVKIDKSSQVKVVYEDRVNIKDAQKELNQNALDGI